MSDPRALGLGGIRKKEPSPAEKAEKPDVSSLANTNALLAMIAAKLDELVERLAAPLLMQEVVFNASAVLTVRKWDLLPSSYNGILASLSAGTVNVWFADSPGTGPPDLVFYGGTNPVYVPLPARNDLKICAQVDAASASAATGKIYLIQY